MGFGIRLRGLWEIRKWVVGCAMFGLLVAGWTVVGSKSVQLATATTQVVVDTPQSSLIDIRQDTHGIDALTNRALLLGNVMATPQVRADIANRAHVPFEKLQVLPPITASQPRVLSEAGHERHSSDILRLDGEYRLYVRANPTVPFLQIYAQTPDPKSAAALANAAVGGTESYLEQLGHSTNTPGTQQVRLMQLGNAEGTIVDQGIRWKFALLIFILAFGASCATVIYVRRVREGWRLAALSGQPVS